MAGTPQTQWDLPEGAHGQPRAVYKYWGAAPVPQMQEQIVDKVVDVLMNMHDKPSSLAD